MSNQHFLASALLAAAATLGSPAAFAHGGAKAQHGGIVQLAHDLSFELVLQADGATIYLQDHGKPLSSAGISGKLSILSGGQKTEAELSAAGDNKLHASGVKIPAGAKVVAVLGNVAGKTLTVRFNVK